MPSPIPTRKGKLFREIRSTYYWLYRFIEGRIIERLNSSHLAQLAKIMASYHITIERFNLRNKIPRTDIYNREVILKEMFRFRSEILRKHR